MSTLGLVGGIPTAVGMVVAWPIARKLGKKRAVVTGLCFSVVGGLVCFLNVHSFGMVAASMVLKGIGSIPAMYVTMALLSDVLDHLEAKNGFRSDGFTMSVYSSIMVGLKRTLYRCAEQSSYLCRLQQYRHCLQSADSGNH